MIQTLNFSYPWWFLILCFLIGSLYAGTLYYREKRFSEYNPWLMRLMALLRMFVVSIISFLLLSPFVRQIEEQTIKPVVVICEDKSESIAAGSTPEDLDIYQNKMSGLVNDLKEAYQILRISFGSDIHSVFQDSMTDKSTHLSRVVTYLDENFKGQNLGAVILSTDGIFNEGKHPLYQNTEIQAPLYTIALGDTTQKKDFLIKNVFHNSIAYLGDKIPVQIDISAFNCQGQYDWKLEEITSGSPRILVQKSINVTSGNFFKTENIFIEADKPGIIRYRVSLSAVKGEFNLANNTKDFFIEILDARQKILILAPAPHPDLSALKSIVSENKNYESEIAFIRSFKGNVADYNMVIFHNLPSSVHDISSLLSQLDRNSIPRIFITGMQTDPLKFNNAQQVIQIKSQSRNSEEIQAFVHSGFSQFILSENLKKSLPQFPPLITPFGEYVQGPDTQVLLYQTIKNIKTRYPMLAFGENNFVKTTVLCGEGLWRWKMIDHLEHQNNDIINELVQKTVLLTSVKEDKRKFRVSTSRNVYRDNEEVFFEAQLFNDTYEMINDPDVEMDIKDEEGNEYRFIFDKSANYYTLNADLLPSGVYSYQARTQFNGQKLTAAGRFNVESVQLENYDLTARHSLLNSLSDKYNGEMFYPANMENISSAILNNKNIKPMMFQTTSTKSLLDLKWVFFLILTLLGIEWLLRRYLGAY